MVDKEISMSFEKRVLTVVEDTLGNAPASFTNGCLFVECTVPEAVMLETMLLKEMKCGIILSRVGIESAFDFV
jgi:hypothetical protein